MAQQTNDTGISRDTNDHHFSCVACERPDSVDNVVACDHCGHWWHFSCAGVTDSVADSNWTCSRCLPLPVYRGSTSSKLSSASRRVRLQLELQHLAEKREFERTQMNLEVEKRFLEKKCQLLQASLLEVDDDVDHRSVRSRVDEIESRERAKSVNNWVEAHSSISSRPPGIEVMDENGATGGKEITEDFHNKDSTAQKSGIVKFDLQLIRKQLDQCLQAAEPTPEQVQELQQLIQRCQIRIQNTPTAQQSSSTKIPCQSTGAIPKNVPKGSKVRDTEKISFIQHAPLPLSITRISSKSPLAPRVPSVPELIDSIPLSHSSLSASPAEQQLKTSGFPKSTGASTNLPQMMKSAAMIASNCRERNVVISNPEQVPSSSTFAVPGIDSSHCATVPSPTPAPPVNPFPPIYRPTQEQLVARQVMPRDLPEFSGDPEDWPIFISSFNHSTSACGYSQVENLARLQRCLKGNAMKAVRFYLLSPESVPDVIKTLQTLYGHPEVIINKLIRNVRESPTPKADKLEMLLEFGITVRNLTQHLIATEHHAHLMNPILLQEIIEKLPANVKLQWAQYIQAAPEVNLRTLSDFMTSVMESVSKVCSFVGTQSRLKDKNNLYAHVEISQENSVEREQTEPEKKCALCKGQGHRVKDCKVFKDSSVENRWKSVHNLKLCRTCLNFHGRRPCRSSNRCGVENCEFRHHPLLHTVPKYLPDQVSNANHAYHHCGQSVLFRILPVTIHSATKSIETFAFLDEGSSATLLESELANELGVKGPTMPLCLKWTANMGRSEDESQIISIEVSEVGKRLRYRLDNARTVRGLNLAPQTLRFDELQDKFPHLAGLPVRSYEAAIPKLLIGLRNLALAVPQKVKEGTGGPIAVKTRLGWCVYGCFEQNRMVEQLNYHLCDCNVDGRLDSMLKDFFSGEDIALPYQQLEPIEVIRARNILHRTTRKIGNRFQTGLLWRFDNIEMPDNFPLALRRLECLERRMKQDEKLKLNVHRQVKEYQDKGYAHAATVDELANADPKRIWYLPLGTVTNPKKTEKVRLVWDAAARTNGISLNSVLISGPDLLTPLPFVLFRFRLFPYAISSDITEMFHQIEIIPTDRHSQRFLFRNEPTDAPTIFLMDVATFGATCSPTIAQFVKNENAKEFAEQYPRAVDGIVKGHYVDDYLDSFATIEEAKKVAAEVRQIHSEGGFFLHNWASNAPAILAHLGELPKSGAKNLTAAKVDNSERVLGMQWSSEIDTLTFSLTFNSEIRTIIESNARPTKRQMLKCVMSIFDPLGLVASFLIHGKVLMQDVWRTGIKWDEHVADKVYDQWQRWIAVFERLKTIQVPRCYFKEANNEVYRSTQIHVFVDASETAYAAAVYFRTLQQDGAPQCSLVTAKAKVAPLKYHSIPRLELMAAVLGTRLLSFVQQGHSQLTAPTCFLWSDSKTVLAWIRSDHRRYQQFVACRVGEILTSSNESQWRWVPSKYNVADEATKWGKGPCFEHSSRWFVAPSFLYYPESDWPQEQEKVSATDEELRSCYIHQMVSRDVLIDFARFSNWNRLVRAVAYFKRFVSRWLRKNNSMVWNADPTQEELHDAQVFLWRTAQAEGYFEEVTILERNKSLPKEKRECLPKTSSLYQLTPFLDEEGVLRIDGRARGAKAPAIRLKCPIILPKCHKITQLLIDSYHQKYLHGNSETIVNEIRQVFHIPHLRVLVRKQSRRCQWCLIYKTKPVTPRMAPLPDARLSPFVRPFSYVGLDYFGPILVKLGRSNVKRWIAVFTCLTIRAVHVEVAFDLTTQSCINCIRRFVCRRGAPTEIHSDNATNFIGSDSVLQSQIQKINQESSATFTNASTKWVFIPPSSPHMGGAWERLVRSIKVAMMNLSQTRKMDDEALQTVVVETEAIVNSRPLTYLPLDSEEQESLTPNHFLLYSSSGIIQPSIPINESARDPIKAYDLIQRNLDHFWIRWTQEYLPTLTRRTKWFAETKPVEVGDLVIVIDEARRNGWVRGRVQEVLPGRDGRIRRAVVQTANGLFRRAVSKLAVLDVTRAGKAEPDTHRYGEENVATRAPQLATLSTSNETKFTNLSRPSKQAVI